MFQVQAIDSLDLPELQPYRTMRRQWEHRQQGIFVAEGEKVVRRLLESRFTVVSALLPEKWFRDLEPIFKSRPELVKVFVAEKAMLETMTGFSMYQGLLALGQVPLPGSLDQILGSSSKPRLLVAVDALSSAENMGAVVRNCAAFNAHAVLVGETCTSPYLRRAIRSSMGAIFHTPVLEGLRLPDCLRELRGRGFRCVAAHTHAERKSLPATELLGDCCLVLGSEGYGVSKEVLDACDEAIAIPMPPTVDSLNVGSAAAVFLYEVNRQRGTV